MNVLQKPDRGRREYNGAVCSVEEEWSGLFHGAAYPVNNFISVQPHFTIPIKDGRHAGVSELPF